MQGDMLDADRARLARLQGVDTHFMEVGGGTLDGRRLGLLAFGTCRLLGQRRTRDELPEIALGGPFDRFRAVDGEQRFLRLQELFEPTAQNRPVFGLDGELAPEIEDGDLAHLAANTLAAHLSKGEIALAGGFVVGSGLPDEYPSDVIEKARENPGLPKPFWRNKTKPKSWFVENQYVTNGEAFE